jgi:hypothetical protein
LNGTAVSYRAGYKSPILYFSFKTTRSIKVYYDAILMKVVLSPLQINYTCREFQQTYPAISDGKGDIDETL